MPPSKHLPFSSLLPGETIGSFEILESLGTGGMGEVYRARDRKLDRVVALKLLPDHPGGREEEHRLLLEEARAASSLDHPNICTVHSIDETADGRAFLTMAAYDGESLRQRLNRGPVSVAEALEITRQVAAGLSAAHDRGTVHRDIKPENLMLTSDGVVKILDFGLAGIEDRRLETTSTLPEAPSVGTTAYASPEQIRGEPTDARSDLWSLGAVLYEALTGQVAFGGADLLLAQRILEEEPKPLPDLAPQIPRELADLVGSMLAKDPGRRPQSAAELSTALDSIRTHLPSATHSAKRFERRWVAGALLLLVITGLAWHVGSGRTQDGAEALGQQARLALDEARQHLRKLDGGAAQAALLAGLEAEPDSAYLHLALAEALQLQGREREALAETERALDLAQQIDPDDLSLFQARVAAARGDHRAAAELLEDDWNTREQETSWTEGERLDRGLELVQALLRSTAETEARQLLQALRRSSDPDDPRLDLVATAALSDWRDRLESARSAATRAEALPAPLLEARARFYEGRALRALGRMTEAEAALRQAIALYSREGHTKGEADAATTLGNLSWDRKDLATAKTLYERAVLLYGRVGHSRLKTRALTNKALVVLDLGDLDAAVEIFREALTEQRHLDDRIGQIYTLVNLAGPLMVSGRLEEATQAYSQATELAESVQEPTALALVLESTGELGILRGDLAAARRDLERARTLAEGQGNRQAFARSGLRLGKIARIEGDLGAAHRFFEQSLQVFEELGDSSSAAELHRALGETLLWGGDFEGSRSHLAEALAIQESGTDLGWSGTRLSLAELLLAERDAEAAATIARQSTSTFARAQFAFDTARGYEILARSLLVRGELEGASSAVEEGKKALGDVDCPLYRLPLLLAEARLRQAAGAPEQAHQLLQSALAEATTHGFLLWELETRLLLGELEVAGGDARAGRARLLQVANEAEQRDLGPLADRARRAAA